MRIVIDMQGAQTESRFRGIGRYTMSFVQAVVRNCGEHEVILVLNGLFSDTIESIREAFDGLLPQENIRVWHAPGPVKEELAANDSRREAAELIRETFLASLQADVIHITSLFEGYVDDAVTSIGRFDTTTPVSVTLYDLIPLQNQDRHFKPNPRYEQYYLRKIDYLRQAEKCLAISNFSRAECLDTLNVADETIVNISTAIDDYFKPQTIDEETTVQVMQKFGIRRAFLLYTGGADERKNLPRLIEAYAAMPENLLKTHQLVIAGRMPTEEIARLQHIATACGLQNEELLFTGYITDEELVQLYNLCALCVFPSWHEGFCLPTLEAMACGAPVVGANTSSLLEMIGLNEALFDPFDVASITQKITKGLVDEAFQARLREHGLKQAKKFSWDETAKRAISAWEQISNLKSNPDDYSTQSRTYNLLLDVLSQYKCDSVESDLEKLSACLAQNESAGIERQLLLDVSELCQRDAATGVQRVTRSYLKWLLNSPPKGFRVEPVYATQTTHGYRYARKYTRQFLGEDSSGVVNPPIRWQRGDIFFGLDMQHHVQLTHADFYQKLRAEGVTVKFLVYDLLPIQLSDLFQDDAACNLHEQWLTMIAATDGAINISQATADSYSQWIEKNNIYNTPGFQMASVHIGGDIEGSQPSRGLPGDAVDVLDVLKQRPTFLCVSTLEPRKRQQQILEAVELLWQGGTDVNLVFVGQQGWKIESLVKRLNKHPERAQRLFWRLGLRIESLAKRLNKHPKRAQRLFWLQGISDEYLEKVYGASTCLISASINEGFGLSLIEAARYGLPVIARDIPVFHEVAGNHAFYFTGETPGDLAAAMKNWLALYRQGLHPQSFDMQWSTWQESTERLKRVLIQSYPRRQLLIDISELVQRDAKTGIQRVVRSILKEWLTNPPAGYRVEPIYATLTNGYRYARQFRRQFLRQVDTFVLPDDPIDYAPGDLFFCLDLQPQVQVAQKSFYQHLRMQGVIVKFVVYDLLCVLLPEYFLEGGSDSFENWLNVVTECDGAVCISKSVADELSEWFARCGSIRQRPFSVDWFHLGADVENSVPLNCLPPDAASTLDKISSCHSFLMVGTLEPRKGHVQVLEAFEQLWKNGQNVNMVIVGKQGWMIDKLVERLRSSPELDKHLFWLEGISDEYLEKVYASCTCLVAASYGEGFGLPLIEAAQHKMPIIARNIPIFREVAGDHAFYFDGNECTQLAEAVEEWLSLYEKDKHPKSTDMAWLTWKESSRNLLNVLRID